MGKVGTGGIGGGLDGNGGRPLSTSMSSAVGRSWLPSPASAELPMGGRLVAMPRREKPGGRSGEDWAWEVA